MNACFKQRFAGVNIPESGDDVLRQKPSVNRLARALEFLLKGFQFEVFRQGFGPQTVKTGRIQSHSAKSPRVFENKASAVKFHDDDGVFRQGGALGLQIHSPGHSQVANQLDLRGFCREVEEKKFGAAADVLEAVFCQAAVQFSGIDGPDGSFPMNEDLFDASAGKRFLQMPRQ